MAAHALVPPLRIAETSITLCFATLTHSHRTTRETDSRSNHRLESSVVSSSGGLDRAAQDWNGRCMFVMDGFVPDAADLEIAVHSCILGRELIHGSNHLCQLATTSLQASVVWLEAGLPNSCT